MARHKIETQPDVVPDNPFFVRLYVEGDQTTRTTLNRGPNAPSVEVNYRTAIRDAERESRRDGKTRWVAVEQCLKESRIVPLVTQPPAGGVEALLDGIGEVGHHLPDPEDQSVDYPELLQAIRNRLGDDKLEELARLLTDAQDPDMRSPK